MKAAILPAYAEVQAVASYVHQGAANGGVNVVTYNVQEAPVSGLQSGLTSKDRVQYIPVSRQWLTPWHAWPPDRMTCVGTGHTDN